MNLEQKAAELQKQKQGAEKELKFLEFLKEFDDEIEHAKRSRYGAKVWISKKANLLASKLEWYYGCGCCPDSDYNARPEMELDFEGAKIYIYGTRIYCGDHDYDSEFCRFITEEELQKSMKNAQYNNTLVELVLKKKSKHDTALLEISLAKERAEDDV